MATQIFDDNFSGYTPGSDNITNFTDIGPFFGQVVDFGTMTGSTPAPGFYERTGHGYGFNGAGGSIVFDQLGGGQNSTQFVWASWAGANPPLPQITIADFSLGTGTKAQTAQAIAWLKAENDNTISVYMQGTAGTPGPVLLVNSGIQTFWPNTWNYYQVNFITGQITLGTITYLTVTATFGFEGTQVCTGAGITDLQVASFYTGGPTFNRWQFMSPFAGGPAGYLGEMTGYEGTGLPAIGTWPHPVTARAPLVTQGVAEVIKAPGNSVREARWTQGVNEVIKAPGSTVRQARVTQGVVEIIKKSGSGWYVYEA